MLDDFERVWPMNFGNIHKSHLRVTVILRRLYPYRSRIRARPKADLGDNQDGMTTIVKQPSVRTNARNDRD